MAATISNIKLLAVYLLLAISIDLSYSGEYSGILSRLYKKAAQNNRPLILVLDTSGRGLKDVTKTKGNQLGLPTSGENDDSNNPLTYLYQMAQSHKKTSVMKGPSKLKHSHVHDVKDLDQHKSRNRDRHQRLRSRDEPKDSINQPNENDRIDNKILKSPVIKSLLRMANGLRCQARNNCADKCEGTKKQVNACEKKCEQKFECEEEKDPCDDTDNECSMETTTSGCNISTRGIHFSEEPGTQCKRC